jgi:hypothetical protein
VKFDWKRVSTQQFTVVLIKFSSVSHLITRQSSHAQKSPRPGRFEEEECHSVFHYHACAHASAGNSPTLHDLIEVQAPAVLPIVGGYGNSRVENFHYREFIHFTKAYARLRRLQESDKSNNTLATASGRLEHLDVLTADRVVARLYTKHPHCKDEGSSAWRQQIENLKIAGHPIVELISIYSKTFEFQEAQIATKAMQIFAK